MSQPKKFLRCETCGNLVGLINDAGVPLMCCGKPMTVLEANSTDAAGEKHVPVAKVADGKVTVSVGTVNHPMTAEHFIPWVYLETKQGGMRKNLQPDGAPEVVFTVGNDEPVAVFAYCNLHGLWKADL